MDGALVLRRARNVGAPERRKDVDGGWLRRRRFDGFILAAQLGTEGPQKRVQATGLLGRRPWSGECCMLNGHYRKA